MPVAYPTKALAAIVLMLGGCAARDPLVSSNVTVPAGNWRIERQTDRITGVPIASALLTAPASNSAVALPQPALLQVTCFRNAPLVRLSFQFKVGSTRNSVFGYRFDDKPGREINGRFLNGFRIVVIEERSEVTPFLEDLKTSKVLYVRIRSLSAGRSTAEFRLAGAGEAVEAALAGCGSGTAIKPAAINGNKDDD